MNPVSLNSAHSAGRANSLCVVSLRLREDRIIAGGVSTDTMPALFIEKNKI